MSERYARCLPVRRETALTCDDTLKQPLHASLSLTTFLEISARNVPETADEFDARQLKHAHQLSRLLVGRLMRVAAPTLCSARTPWGTFLTTPQLVHGVSELRWCAGNGPGACVPDLLARLISDRRGAVVGVAFRIEVPDPSAFGPSRAAAQSHGIDSGGRSALGVGGGRADRRAATATAQAEPAHGGQQGQLAAIRRQPRRRALSGHPAF